MNAERTSHASPKDASPHPGSRAGMQASPALCFLDYTLDLWARELRRAGRRVELQPKPFELLCFLVQERARAVSKQELLDALWPEVNVSEQALSSAVRDLRRALEEGQREQRLIATVRGHGYRFTGLVRGQAEGTVPGGALATADPDGDVLVEREVVLEQLRAGTTLAQAGQGQLSLLSGPPGSGKSRIAREVLTHHRELGVDAVLGCCFSGDAVPYWPWIQILRACVELRGEHACRELVASQRTHIGTLLPELAPPPAHTATDELARTEARFWLFDSVLAFLASLARTRPLLVVLDDLQWADEPSLRLLEFMAQHMASMHVHTVALARSASLTSGNGLTRLFGDSARYAHTRHIEVDGLSEGGVELLLRLHLPHPPSTHLAHRVYETTGGNPFFVSEIARLLRARSDAGESLLGDGKPLPIPGRVRDAIRLRLAGASPVCVELLRLAAVIGREFVLAEVTNASGRSAEPMLGAIDEAVRAGLLRAQRGSVDRYSFVHDVTRETVLGATTELERVRLHGRLAESLESQWAGLPDQPVEEIAHHYGHAAAAGFVSKAIQYARRAAEVANQRMAYEEAVEQYGRALAASRLDPSVTPEQRCALSLARAEARWGTDQPLASIKQGFDDVVVQARALNEPELHARAVLGRTAQGTNAGPILHDAAVEEVAMLQEACSMLPAGRADLRALLLARLSAAQRYLRGFEEADRLSREAVELAEGLDPATHAEVLCYRHEVLVGPEFVQDRLAIAEQIVALARAARSRLLEIDGLYCRSRDHFELAQISQALKDGLEGDALSRTLHHPGALYREGIRKVMFSILEGEFERAREEIERFYERDRCRNQDATGTRRLQHLAIFLFEGRHRDNGKSAEEREPGPWSNCLHCRMHAMSHEWRPARILFDRLAAADFTDLPRDDTYTGCLLSLSETAVLLKDHKRAARLYELLLPYESRLCVPFLSSICEGPLSRIAGKLAGMIGHVDEARRHFEEALATLDTTAWLPLRALARADYGELLLSSGRDSDAALAHETLSEAHALARRLDMRGLRSRLKRLRRSSAHAVN